jgi:hypothetical protein
MPPPAAGGSRDGPETLGQAVVVVSNQLTNTAAHVDLSVTHGGTSTRTYCVSGVAKSQWSLFDAMIIAFAAVFQIPYASSGVFPSAAGGVEFHPVDSWVSSTVGLTPYTLGPSFVVSPIAFVLVAVVVLRVLWASFNSVPVESVTAIRGIGLQVSKRTSRGDAIERVIDVNSIDCLVIHEGYFRHQTVYFLAVVVRDSPQSVVLFADTLPRLTMLRVVLRGLRHVLYQEPEHGLSLAEANTAS